MTSDELHQLITNQLVTLFIFYSQILIHQMSLFPNQYVQIIKKLIHFSDYKVDNSTQNMSF